MRFRNGVRLLFHSPGELVFQTVCLWVLVHVVVILVKGLF